jgi:hypothetical protein
MPFVNIENSRNNICPCTLLKISKNIDIQHTISVMEAYLRDSVHIIEDHYVAYISSKSRDEFSPREDVVDG